MTTEQTPPETVPASPAPFRLTEGELPPVIGGELALSDLTPTLTLGGGFLKERHGKPCFYWDKESIGPGTILDARGVTHNLTPKDADDIVEDVSRAMSLGHEPSIPDRHFGTPARNFGWVKGIRKNAKGNIVLTHQHVGEAENNDALNLKTSVMLRRNFTDERGRKWRWWLDHNCATDRPQLRDLEDFKPATLAASSDGQPAEVDYVVLAAQPQAAATPPGEPPMDWTKMRGAIGDTAKDVPDEKMMDHSVAHVDKCHARMKKVGMALSADAVDAVTPDVAAFRAFWPEATAGKTDAEVVALAAEQVVGLSDERDAANRARGEAELALSAATADPEPDMDPRVRSVLAEGVADSRQLCLDAGAPPSLVSELDALFNEKDGNPNDLALSAVGPQSRPLARQVYRSIASHMKDFIAVHNTVPRTATPVKPTKAAMALSGDDSQMTPADVSDDDKKRMRELYNIPQPAAAK